MKKPELGLTETWYYQEFQELSRDRGYIEGSPLPLTTSQIHAYWEIFDYEDFENFYRVMRILDSVWIKKVTERRNKETSTKQTSKQNAPIPRNTR